MLAELLLVSRLLGLVNGEQPLFLQVGPTVQRVDVVSDGRKIGTVTGAPWGVILNFGPELAPHELTAIAYDAQGNEVARDTQLVNLARPPAELIIDLARDESGPLRATLRWEHIGAEKPKRIEIKVDGQTISSGKASATLPELSPGSVHVIEGELEFPGGVVARKELVFGGIYSEQVPTELTAVLVHEGESGKKDLASCFSVEGKRVTAAAVEKPEGLVHFVRASDPIVLRRKLRMPTVGREGLVSVHRPFGIDDAKFRYIWPTSTVVHAKDRDTTTNLFLRSAFTDGKQGTQRFLTYVGGPRTKAERFIDAVAVAGVQALNGAQRRAVVLVLTGERDHSRHTAPIVRRYLERIGVPLRVWSVVSVRPEMKEAWGDVKDVSNVDYLRRATEELRRELDKQRIAWLPLQPIDALRVKAEEGCAYAPVARR